MLTSLFLGVVLVVGCIANTRFVAGRLGLVGAQVRRFERQSWSVCLVLAALIYVGFALRPGGQPWMLLELGGLAAGVGLCVLGLRWWPAVAGGWLLHGLWDAVLHAEAPPAVVPEWYRWACLSFDLVVAGYLTWRWVVPSDPPEEASIR